MQRWRKKLLKRGLQGQKSNPCETGEYEYGVRDVHGCLNLLLGILFCGSQDLGCW